MDGLPPEGAGNTDQHSVDLEDDRVYLVPYRWFREAQELSPEAGGNSDPVGSRGILYTASSASFSYGGPMKLINNLFNSDLAFNLQREEESRQNDSDDGASSRSYALIRTDIWLQTLKWHNDLNTSMKGGGNSSVSEYGAADVYALMLRISVVRETNIMLVKISKRDNTVEYYKRASKIFTADSEPIRIWDFSGQTTLIFMNERNKLHGDCQQPLDQEILLELHVYSLLQVLSSRTEGRKDDLVVQQSKKAILSNGGSVMSNGSIGSTDSAFIHANARALNGVCSLGLTGLENLGNTCFMNSAIQCLAHTPKLIDYFLGNYFREINQQNPLGMDGELALAFGDLLRKLWAPDRTPVIPRPFKTKLAHFAPQFSGFNQHDSQELLAFLLDGLHEDLNRVKCKPYIEAKDEPDRSDEEVADEYWANHLARNDSIIVDLFQGQYRSTLVCPACNKVSVTFDPFMYLSLPLPSTMMRTMTVTVFSTDGSAKPSPYTVTVPKYGKCKDLVQSLSIACSLRDDESLLVAEVYSNSIIRYLEEPSDSLSLLRDGDRLAAYRMTKDTESLPLVVFLHQRMEEQYIYGKITSHWKSFGVPLITRLSGTPNGSTIQNLFLKLLDPFQKVGDTSLDDQNGENSSPDKASNIHLTSLRLESEGTIDASDDGTCHTNEVQYFLTDARGQMKQSKIEMSEEILVMGLQKHLHLLVCWSEKMVEQYDISHLNSLPEIYKSGLFPKWPQDSVSLYACLEAFLKEEPLGPEDMWYCPCCKMHRQASKKLDLWRLPEVLVIHLKRFSYSRFMKNKLETFVDFPTHDFDLSTYIAHKTGQPSHHYELFAMSNHYGNMGGGHYTAYVHHAGEDRWYDFDDRHVIPKPEDSIKTSAAYVLFYRRVCSQLDP